MKQRHQILVVAQDSKLANRLVAWLRDEAQTVCVVTTFAAAKAALEAIPDILVAEVKLGEYNGLHLALRAHMAGIPSVVIGPDDAVLRKDAEAIGAGYLTPPADRGQLVQLLDRFLNQIATGLPPLGVPAVDASEAEMLWRAFSESPSTASALGRSVLPN